MDQRNFTFDFDWSFFFVCVFLRILNATISSQLNLITKLFHENWIYIFPSNLEWHLLLRSINIWAKNGDLTNTVSSSIFHLFYSFSALVSSIEILRLPAEKHCDFIRFQFSVDTEDNNQIKQKKKKQVFVSEMLQILYYVSAQHYCSDKHKKEKKN